MTSMTERANDMMEQVQPMANEVSAKLSEAGSRLSEFTSKLEPRLTELEKETRVFIRQQPVMAVFMAVGVGYLLARVAAMTSRR